MLSFFNCVRPPETTWTVAHKIPLFMGFSRQEYWSELPFPPSGNLPNSGIKPTFLTSPALASGFFTTSTVPANPFKARRHLPSATYSSSYVPRISIQWEGEKGGKNREL